MDKLSSVFQHFSFHAEVFFSGNLCNLSDFSTDNDLCGHLHFLRSGALTLIDADHKHYQFDKPCILFFPKKRFHRIIPNSEEGIDIVCATITYQNVMSNPVMHSLPSFMSIPLDGDENPRFDKLGQTASWLFEEAFADQNGKSLIINRLCDIFIVQLLREIITQNKVDNGILAGLAHPSLSHALLAIHEQPSVQWTVQLLAEKSLMSRAKFADLFHAVVGDSPLNYLTQWRLGLAQDLLRKGMSISEVSNQVGYESNSSFSRVFSKRLGESPKQWLKQQAVD